MSTYLSSIGEAIPFESAYGTSNSVKITSDTFTWPAITTTDNTTPVLVYRTQPALYPIPSIQIDPPMSNEEFIQKLRDSIQEYFGISDLLPKADEVKIEESQKAPIPLRRGRRIERVE